MNRRSLLGAAAALPIATVAEAGLFRRRGGTSSGGGSDTLIAVRTGKNWDGSSTPATFYPSIGQGFAPNAVPNGSIVQMRLNDGTTVIAEQQVNNRVTHADGSLKFANFIWKHPNQLSASASETVKFYSLTGSWPDSTSITTGPLLAQDYRVEIVIGGTTYYCLLNNELTAGTRVVQIRSGAACAAWKVWGELRAGTSISDTAQGQAWVVFYAYVYSDGTTRIWAELQGARASLTTNSTLTLSSCKLKNGGTDLIDNGATTLYAATKLPFLNSSAEEYYSGTDTQKVVWAFPLTVAADPTTRGMYDSHCLWWYKSTPTMIANIPDGTAENWSANFVSLEYQSPDNTGAHTFYGPVPQSCIQAYLLGSYASLRKDRINATAGNTNPWWYLDFPTSYPPVINGVSYPGLTNIATDAKWGILANYTLVGDVVAGAVVNPTHAPLYCYYQYLYGGQEWWLDTLHGQVNGCIGAYSDYRNITIDGVAYVGVTWSTYSGARSNTGFSRYVADSQWVTPDAHTVKPYIDRMNSDDKAAASSETNRWTTIIGSGNPLGILDLGTNPIANSGWMHDFLMFTLAMSGRRGHLLLTDPMAAHHLTKWVVGRGSDACLATAPDYNRGIKVGPNPTGEPYALVWSDVYIGDAADGNMETQCTNPEGSGCPASPTVIEGGGIGYTTGITNYPNIYHASMVCAEIFGLNQAGTARSYYDAVEAAASLTEASWGANGCHMRIRLPA